MYNPDNQYRCTIIRGKSQTEMEDLLPLYANIVHKYCPCNEAAFRKSACSDLASALFHIRDFNALPDNNIKTVKNHLTEIMGVLLGLYYPKHEIDTGETIIYESESCKFIYDHSDYPTFFKNLCLNFQFPNGEKKATVVKEEIEKGIRLKPFCFVVSLLHVAQQDKQMLTKQEIGYYALNNLDVLQGKVTPGEVYKRIISDRANGVRHNKLSGSHEWQHIKEQFNLLELANLIEHDAERIWLNTDETYSLSLFINSVDKPFFRIDSYDLSTADGRKLMVQEWKEYNGTFNPKLLEAKGSHLHILSKTELSAGKSTIKSSTDLGDEGEALVYRLEQDRVRAYKPRLVNKVLLLGKTKGLGYDIASVEADECPKNPEFARYIEVKTTKRTTRPSFNDTWSDSLNITRKEWGAAEQFGNAYNIYRVYFTKEEVIVVRIQNPFALSQSDQIEVVPTVYQMEFGADVIENRYPECDA